MYKQSVSGTYELLVSNDGYVERLEAIAARICPGTELAIIPYDEYVRRGEALQGIATVEFTGEGLPEICFEGSRLL